MLIYKDTRSSYLLASLSRAIATRTLLLKKININKMEASVNPRDTTDKHKQQYVMLICSEP